MSLEQKLNDFIKNYQYKEIGYPAGSYVGECLSLVKVWMKETYGFNPPPSGSNSAYGYWSNFPDPLGQYFTKVKRTSNVPKTGDIVVWNTNVGNGYGHIAIVRDADLNGFNSFDQNWGGRQADIKSHNYTNVVGFLRPKEEPVVNGELEACLKDREKFWGERDELLRELNAESVEGGINTIRGLRSRITDLTNQVGTAQAEAENQREKASRVSNELLETLQQLELVEVQLQSKNEELTKMAKEKGQIAIDLEKAKVQIETLKRECQQGTITLTLGDIIRLLLQGQIKIRRSL